VTNSEASKCVIVPVALLGVEGRTRLVACVSPMTVSRADVLAACAEGLPRFMVPSDVLHVSEWPLTATGKIDYRAVVQYATENQLGGTPSVHQADSQRNHGPSHASGANATASSPAVGGDRDDLTRDGVDALARADVGPSALDGVTLATAAEADELCDADVAGTWTPNDVGGANDVCIDQAVRAQALRAPAAVAVVHGAGALSYDELEKRVCAVSAALSARHGVRHGDRVGVYATRSPDMVVAMLAVMRVGAAYVPLDPTHPERRTSMICEDAGIGLLLRTSDTVDPTGFLATGT